LGVAVQAMLGGMPVPRDLHRDDVDGQVIITVGSAVLFSYDAADAGLRNLAAVTLPEMGFTGRRVAHVLGITEVYVSMLRTRARAEGSAGLMHRRGRPAAWGPAIRDGHVPGAGRESPTRRSGNVWVCMARRWPGRWLASSGRARMRPRRRPPSRSQRAPSRTQKPPAPAPGPGRRPRSRPPRSRRPTRRLRPPGRPRSGQVRTGAGTRGR
jgi:hypothetical protein